jgi:hypothetical protein
MVISYRHSDQKYRLGMTTFTSILYAMLLTDYNGY